MKNKVLLISSPGGHFVQLSLLAEMLDEYDVIVAGTYDKKPSFIVADRYYKVDDFSRDDAYKSVKVLFQCLKLLRKEKPKLVITTGAAPGLVMLFLSKFLGIKSIWIDSVANSQTLSLSGKIAKKLGVQVLSQWEKVAEKCDVNYYGRLI
ncbi:glycosyltransferase family protein [Vibrio penaeicida]|uniref:Glucosyl transferase n=1 Tax=Vibrio penaeicida TaxID=104609 RepID=A0AAV5NZ34_9VIBR|nr:oligosaccharide biosynthesis protein Alg14 [Vibrio penaeicida]RTZ19332.1 oligosaccharide biosynthesis protein Alg14 [Vibrio penaeicida]GLQ75302.1 glucosyl transferase [Vibrio penaeicida]